MLKTAKSFAFGSRRRKVFTGVLTTILVGGGAAVAAFLLYAGTSGSGQAHFSSSSTVDAITITSTQNPELVPGSTVAQGFVLTNNDPGASHQIATLNATITTSVSGCEAYLSFDTTGIPFVSVPAGGTSGTLNGHWTVSPSTSASCAGVTATVSFSGTTA